MNSNPLLEKLPPPLRRRPVLLAVAVAAIALLLFLLFRPSKSNGAATSYHEVRRGDFTVTVVEGGTLAAVSEVSIRNEVEGMSARIISIVPEGSFAKKGDLLVELDSAQAEDQVNQQQIAYEKATFAVEQAKAQLDIARSATNSDFLTVDLKLKFAKIDREKYLQGQMKVDRIEAQNKVVQASNQLTVSEETYRNSTNLAAKGYETKQKEDADRLSVLSTRNALTVATNTLWMLEEFDVRKLLEKYDSDVLQAEKELERVVIQNERKMAQYLADLSTQINTLKLSGDKLERDKKNLNATKIYAPQDGLVVYQVSENRFSSESLIEGGATIRNRQELIKLPDLSRMKVNIKIHESHVNMVRPGLPAYVMLDSMPEVRFAGFVQKVAPLPDTQSRFGNPNLKVYNTEIYLTDTVPNVKPGVSAKAEIIVTNIANTLSVPIQAVTSSGGKPVVYLANRGKSEPRPVEVGAFNTKFIEITKGLNEGDRVLLSPPFDTQDKDLEGAVLAEDEKARAATNLPPRAATSPAVPAASGLPGIPAAAPAMAGPPDAAAGSPGDGAPTGRDRGDASGRRGGFNPEEMLKQYDKNGDGQIDDTEREAMRAAMAARSGGQGGPGGPGGGRLSREEMLKRFDKNGDGQLDEEETAAMRSSFGGGKGGAAGQGGAGGGRGSRSGGGGTEREGGGANGGGRAPGPGAPQ